MDNNEIILTPEGRAKLVEELEWREGEKDAEIIARIKEARDFGDLSENAEYDAAKDEPRAVSEPWRLSAPYHHKLRGARRCHSEHHGAI